MSRVNGNTFIVEPEPHDKCELCGNIDELRPYGPNGKRICFSCGMKDRDATLERFNEATKDVDTVVQNDREVTVLVLPKFSKEVNHD